MPRAAFRFYVERTAGRAGRHRCFDGNVDSVGGQRPRGRFRGTSFLLRILPYLEQNGIYGEWDFTHGVAYNAPPEVWPTQRSEVARWRRKP